jgi:hypothetical protein
MHYFALTVLLTCLLVSPPASAGRKPELPKCGSDRQGKYWPEEANGSREKILAAARCGILHRCVKKRWTYKWERWTISFQELKGEDVSCEARPQTSVDDDPAKADEKSTLGETN